MVWFAALTAVALLAAGLGLAYVIALLAMPLFIFVGEIMNRAEITRILIDLSMALVSRLPGGLGHVNIMTSVFFTGLSGSAVADSAALSNTLVPAMRERGRCAGRISKEIKRLVGLGCNEC